VTIEVGQVVVVYDHHQIILFVHHAGSHLHRTHRIDIITIATTTVAMINMMITKITMVEEE
tara:strand:+ start:28 stop:210 length:183 start_codon:yes stop_codon:yes gene_type:complete